MKTIFHKILATTAICLAAMGLSSCSAQAAPNQAALELAEQQIRLQRQKNPKLSYHSLTYKATLQECMAGSKHFYKQIVLTLQGTWIPVHELPPETLVFRGEKEGFKLGTLGGAGYFFCSPETGELVAYVRMR